MAPHFGQLAQRESVRFTREWSEPTAILDLVRAVSRKMPKARR